MQQQSRRSKQQPQEKQTETALMEERSDLSILNMATGYFIPHDDVGKATSQTSTQQQIHLPHPSRRGAAAAVGSGHVYARVGALPTPPPTGRTPTSPRKAGKKHGTASWSKAPMPLPKNVLQLRQQAQTTRKEDDDGSLLSTLSQEHIYEEIPSLYAAQMPVRKPSPKDDDDSIVNNKISSSRRRPKNAGWKGKKNNFPEEPVTLFVC